MKSWPEGDMELRVAVFCTPSVLLTQYCAGGEIETNEMARACGAYGGGYRGAQGVGGEA